MKKENSVIANYTFAVRAQLSVADSHLSKVLSLIWLYLITFTKKFGLNRSSLYIISRMEFGLFECNC